MTILSNANTNTNSEVFRALKPMSVLLTGTFDGAIVTLQVSSDKSTWVNASPSDASFSEPQAFTINLHGGLWCRLVLSNAGASTQISAEIYS